MRQTKVNNSSVVNTSRNGFKVSDSRTLKSRRAARAREHPVVGAGMPVVWYRIEGGIRPTERKYKFHPR
jgi:hypothetical protein